MTLQQLSSKKYPDKGTGLQRIAYEDGVGNTLEALRKLGLISKNDYAVIIKNIDPDKK